MGGFLNMNLRFCFLAISLEMLLIAETYASSACDIDIENTLTTLLTQDKPSLQVKALRRDLLKKLIEQFEQEIKEDARLGVSSTSNNLPYEMKRNLESLARAGYIRTLPEVEDDADASSKRSIASLAKNGQLSSRLNEKEKKGIESLARNGELHPRRDIRQLLEELYAKRNLASLARDYNFPVYGKKSLSSLAKSGNLPYTRLQRSTDAVARAPEDILHKENSIKNKGNLQAAQLQLKSSLPVITEIDSSGRFKRDADYFYSNEELASPAYQSQNVYDYDDLLQEISDADVEKRFLGSVAKSGWFQPSSGTSRYSRFASPDKRHIGSLARLGWLPGFRHIRRFNRSGRSTSSDDICREVASNGEIKAGTDAKDTTFSIENRDRDYGRPPANFLLRNLFFHPRSM